MKGLLFTLALAAIGCTDEYHVTVRAIEFTGELDDSGPNEIEVYLFDDVTDELIGCAGTKQGMGDADDSNVRYDLHAQLVDRNGKELNGNDIEGRVVHFEVWEDDDSPVCPTVPSASGNELMGVSVGLTAREWMSREDSFAFDQITLLRVTWD